MARDSVQYVRRRVSAFLADQQRSGESLAGFHVRNHTIAILGRLRKNGVAAYLVGGTIRDLCCAPQGVTPRDIDVIVEGVSTSRLRSLFDDLFQRETRFGGLHLLYRGEVEESISARFSVMFDVWRLEDTWALRKCRYDATIQRFPCSTFLNLDSAAVELWPSRPGGRAVLDCGFFDCLRSKTIEVNLADNPFPAVCAVRSLVVAAKLQFKLGESVVSFLTDNTIGFTPEVLMDAQLSHYGIRRCSEEELGAWLDLVFNSKRAGLRTVLLPVTAERQLELWSWPDAREDLSQPRERELIDSCGRPSRNIGRRGSQLRLFGGIPTVGKGHQ
jgi:hypothetical protein